MKRKRTRAFRDSMMGQTAIVLATLVAPLLVYLSCNFSIQDQLPTTPSNGVTHAPTIASIVGSGVDHGLITLSGINFGSHSLEVEWTGGTEGMIEALPANTEMRDAMRFWSTSRGIWREGLSSDVTRPHISSARAHSHNNSIKGWVDKAFSGSWQSAFEYKHAQTFDEMYATWWAYMDPISTDSTGHGGWKMWRLVPEPKIWSRVDDVPGSFYFAARHYSATGLTKSRSLILYCARPECWGLDYDAAGLDYDESDSTLVCSSNWWCIPSGDNSGQYVSIEPSDGRRWVRWEVYAKRSTLDGKDGTIQWWVSAPGMQTVNLIDWPNNVCTHRNLSGEKPFYQDAPESWRYLIWQNYWAQGGRKADFFFDDIYMQFDTGKARVELGDSDVWETCRHREIQSCVAWSNDSIQVRLNQGSFSAGNQVYLYVVNKYGVVSEASPPLILQ